MLYEEGKPGRKRIGEDMADLISKTFGLDINSDATEKPFVHLVAAQIQTDKTKEFALEVAALVNLYGQSTNEGRRRILRLAKNAEKTVSLSQLSVTTTD